MADYFPLISRAIAQLDSSTGEARRAIYERARTALVTQLRGTKPPLDESDITRERLALEEAIRKAEAEAARAARQPMRPAKEPTQPSDPLAELARLVGQNDPFAAPAAGSPRAVASATPHRVDQSAEHLPPRPAPPHGRAPASSARPAAPAPHKVFISYRRDDARYPARDIYRAFAAVLPPDHVFMDVDSIPPGANFLKILEDWVDRCDILLALIGAGWINSIDPKTGVRRLDNPKDFVRIEIRKALSRNIPVVPVILDGAAIPEEDALPDDLKELAVRHAEFVNLATFDHDVERLMRKLGFARKPVA